MLSMGLGAYWAGYRAPVFPAASTACRIAATSSGVSWTLSAPKFSSRFSILVVLRGALVSFGAAAVAVGRGRTRGSG